MQFMFGLWLFDEDMSPARWLGFSLVWVSLLLLTADSVRRRHVDSVDVVEPTRV
jgi:chloramphenicol-sensitive protein RarD